MRSQRESDSASTLRERAGRCILVIYAGLIAFVVLLVLLQGFNLGGFHLDSPVFNWVGTIVAAVVGLAAMVYRSLFGR